jgi:MYXO-CTERM domain-containing protein
VDGGLDNGNNNGSDNDLGKVSGGCATGGGGSGLPVALALLGFVGLRRRRR